MSDKKNKPLETLRRGALKIAIWSNSTDKGIRYSTDGVVRSYPDPNQEGQWKETRSLSNGELLQAARLLQLADDFIYEQIAIEKAKAKSNAS